MRLHIPALLTIVVMGLGSARVHGQTLADVAKKEEERRKTVKESGKTYTNKDLGTLPPGTPLPPAKPAASTDAAAKETEKPPEQGKVQEKEKEPAKDQAYWSGRMKELQTQLQRDQTYVDALQTRVNSLATDFVNRDDPAQRGVLAGERQKALGELERLKKQVEATKKAIADLEEEARRANVPPGWLR
jgi:DNA repair exonuclease SbcCD ATPase subunit